MKSEESDVGKIIKRSVAGCSVVLAAIFLAILALFKGCSFSLGLMPGNSGTSSNTSNSSYSDDNSKVDENAESEGNAEADEDVATTVQITVSGSEYIYENSTIDLDDLISELKDIDGKIIVEITDDNSSIKAYSMLKAKLTLNRISFVEIEE